MHADRQLASWLIAHRLPIESAMNARLGPAAPGAGDPSSEALRRFRSFLCNGLVRGEAVAAAPALDGLRLNERRVMALVDAWIASAETVFDGRAPAELAPVRPAVTPWADRFRLAVRTAAGGRKRSAPTRVARRAVAAAIDRVADGFLAIDTDTAEIVDANPAAGALLGVNRDALLGVDALSFVPAASRAGWWTELDAMTESAATRAFGAQLCDALGGAIDVDATMTRFATRGRVLALLLLRPRSRAERDAR